jgi:hypothetical protein
VGALLPAVIYNYVDGQTRFWIVCWFGFLGCVLTFVFIPDTTGLDLREQDRYWTFVRAGRAGEYRGIAVHPRHLSWYERVVLKRHLAYDAEKDREMRVQELRVAYEEKEASGTREKTKEEEIEEEEDEMLSMSASTYFASKSAACVWLAVADKSR